MGTGAADRAAGPARAAGRDIDRGRAGAARGPGGGGRGRAGVPLLRRGGLPAGSPLFPLDGLVRGPAHLRRVAPLAAQAVSELAYPVVVGGTGAARQGTRRRAQLAEDRGRARADDSRRAARGGEGRAGDGGRVPEAGDRLET